MFRYRRLQALLLALMLAALAFPGLAAADGLDADDPDTLTINLTGRIGLGDTTRWNTNARSLTRVGAEQADDWLLGDFADLFLHDDLTLGSLHMPFINDGIQRPGSGSLNCAPENAVRFLTAAGIDAVSLADDKVSDFGTDGYRNTQRVLSDADILYCGTIETRSGDRFDELMAWTVKNIRIGVVAYSNPSDRTVPAILDRVRLLRQHDCALIIVSLDWGENDATSPTAQNLSIAQRLIDGGVDVIWGHGSDALQPIYFYNGKPIISSLGTLCDGYSGAVATFGAVLTLRYDISGGTPVLREMRATPFKTGDRGVYRPFILGIQRNITYTLNQFIPQRGRENLVTLPREFANTGVVRIEADGTLTAGE